MNEQTPCYWAHDPRTGLVHVARKLSISYRPVNSGMEEDIHATFCDEEVGAAWAKSTAPIVTTCLLCLAADVP